MGVDGVGLRGRGLEAGEAGSGETGIDQAGRGHCAARVPGVCGVAGDEWMDGFAGGLEFMGGRIGLTWDQAACNVGILNVNH